MLLINNYNDLYKRINDDSSLLVVRLGNVETTSFLRGHIYEQMFTNAGFYCKKGKPNEIYSKWKNLYYKAVLKCDVMLDVVSCDSFQIVGDFMNLINSFVPALAYVEDPEWWIKNIICRYKGTIGIVSYFKEDIEKQITVLDKIWPQYKIKNKFLVVKSHNTTSGNTPHNNWLETYKDLCRRIDSKSEPNLWLVSAGCYGLPVCYHISHTNKKKAIYVGGLLQLLFGLKGKRWDEREDVKKHYNDSWIYSEQKPTNAEQVEGWCYGK